MKQVSIITINLNNLEGLKKTVDSVFIQTCRNDIEFIIIDGESNDGSKEYLKTKETGIDYWVSEPDTGIFNAMNKGIAQSMGEYLLFLNSGDYLNGEFALNDFISNPEFMGDIIYGDIKYIKGNRRFQEKLSPLFLFRSSLPHQATLFKRKVFQEMGNYDESYKIAADSEFYVRCFLSNKYVFKYVPIELSVFDLLGISNNKKYQLLNKKERTRLLKENYGVFYDDYVEMLEQRIELAKLKANTLKDFFKRVVYKIKILKDRLIYD